MTYFKIRSWHVVLNDWVSRGGMQMYSSFCGRQATKPETATELPADEKSCETCLRIVHRRLGVKIEA